MKKLLQIGVAAAAVVGLSVIGAQAATATVLYDNVNYTGTAYGPATSAPNVGSLNDKASSFTNSGSKRYWEDSGYLGRSVVLSNNYNNLTSVTTNLGLGESWSDRISSFN